MIWFFLAGFIGGTVGMWLVVLWWVREHVAEMTYEELKKELDKTEEILKEEKRE